MTVVNSLASSNSFSGYLCNGFLIYSNTLLEPFPSESEMSFLPFEQLHWKWFCCLTFRLTVRV